LKFRSIFGDGEVILTEEQADVCQNLVAGSCPLLTGNEVLTHHLQTYTMEALPAGQRITFEVSTQNSQNTIVSCFEIDLMIV
jgi:ML domain